MLGYVGVFLRDKPPERLNLSPPAVDVGMAIGLLRDDKQLSIYVIEPNSTLRPGPAYLAPDHGLAKILLGHAVGDKIELPDHSQVTIGWIKPKELHALHGVLEEFNNHFPEAEGLEKVRIDESRLNSLEPMLERVRMRHDAVQNVANSYDKGTLPLALMARLVGADFVSTFLGLINSGHKILVCEGTQFERDAAFQVIRDNGARGCVVDAVTLHLIRRLNLENAVQAICGPIGIVEHTMLRLQEEIHELEGDIDRPGMTVFYRDGQYYRDEATPERKREALAVMQADQQWLRGHAEVLPATGTKNSTANLRLIEQKFGRDFFDEVRAADGSGRMLLTEDHVLRTLAFSESGVRGAWLQPVLMNAADAGAIAEEKYVQAVLGLIDANEEFISISGKLLYRCLVGTSGHALPANFRKLASRLGGPKANTTHLAVALEAVASSWGDQSLSWTVQQAVLGQFLENLTKGRSLIEVQAIVGAVGSFGRRQMGNAEVEEYVRGWLRGHFINLDELATPRRGASGKAGPVGRGA